MTFVKVCGITRAEDAAHALQSGATAVGFVFWPASPRYVEPRRAAAIIRSLPYGTNAVGVFVNQPVEEIAAIVGQTGITAVQLHGDEPVSYLRGVHRPVIKATSLAGAEAVMNEWPADTLLLLDAHDPVQRGGTGRTVDWRAAADVTARRRVVLAGGLTPDNVQEAIAEAHPFGVDVSSGVEDAPGVKNVDKITQFIERVREADGGQ